MGTTTQGSTWDAAEEDNDIPDQPVGGGDMG